ncbi:RagB/SusD family nutrient uptake outer membrane protein [Pinibacter aurantiacus]|uniref:RagB/SusD family nutrient uptake outer membrane protein n=1 Tax=Pinibacter aurantiacus TaxID=2851599 RepID=A0A9E2SBK0_9BACT|nr:RagB/SusD family nutrient uptake outer membrane protein [Pinibacter aurantiacus]MBV4358408.1 RagB/SusD family nutrient uptake outer membrane protein [Pinibacter aurantiacus]
MTNKNIYKLIIAGAIAFSSCTKDLDRKPIVDVTSDVVYSSPATIKEALAKLYGGLSLSGQDGTNPVPVADIDAQDVGSNGYLRNYWEVEELTTDEAIIAWNDGDLQNYNTNNWNSNNTYIKLTYNRIYFNISQCNEFLRQLPDSKVSGFPAADAANINGYKLEARFLRALFYWNALDLFGDVPVTTEKDAVGNFSPKQMSRADLFKFVETELLDIQNTLPDAGKNEYGRADKGTAWMLLAKLYLNAKVYTGTDRSTDAITYANKITSSGAYSLAATYRNLFLTDSRATSKEIIFPIRANGLTSQSYSNTTFIIHGSTGGKMSPPDYGINGSWSGLRTRKEMVTKFPDLDSRAMFFTEGQTIDINNITDFTNGYAVVKYKNVSSTGAAGSDKNGTFVDTDFPLFRLADVYLIYAEAVLRGGAGGDRATALGYINALRNRAYGGTSGNITDAAMTLDLILDERVRELYWEAHRRTDLVRFGKYTGGTYLWQWKGGVQAGTSIDNRFNLFPIPTTDLTANPTLKPTPGY